MVLVEQTSESEELVRCKEPNASNSVAEDGEKHLDVIKVQIFSAGDNCNELLDEVKESVFSGEPREGHALKSGADQLAGSSWSTSEIVTPETADDGKESNGHETDDDDFSANDLLRFAWQIAQGMVKTFVSYLFERVGSL